MGKKEADEEAARQALVDEEQDLYNPVVNLIAPPPADYNNGMGGGFDQGNQGFNQQGMGGGFDQGFNQGGFNQGMGGMNQGMGFDNNQGGGNQGMGFDNNQ